VDLLKKPWIDSGPTVGESAFCRVPAASLMQDYLCSAMLLVQELIGKE